MPATDVTPEPCAELSEEMARVDSARLAELALFSSIDEATLTLLSERLPLITIASGDTIFDEGDSGRAMYVLLEGAVTFAKRSKEGHITTVAKAQAGDWFGEMSLLDVMARPVTATATGDCRLLAICPTDLTAVYRSDLKMYALLVMNMARQLSRKLRGAELSLACALCGESKVDES